MSTKTIGALGEEVACKYLMKNNFQILERNFRRIWGEIDIIAIKDSVLHFFEVKSVTFEFSGNSWDHKPEDNVHGLKLKHIGRMIETYLEDKGGGLSSDFRFHVICVYLDMKTRKARIKLIENIIL